MVREERKGQGRSKIWSNNRTTSFSRRALNGDLELIDFDCPKCHHHKGFKNKTFVKCSRCGYCVRIRRN